jgi:hypothetical protein
MLSGIQMWRFWEDEPEDEPASRVRLVASLCFFRPVSTMIALFTKVAKSG